jgi:SAM-dependent methyltransferase
MIERRSGAPRLIEWTGERCVPWTPEIPVAYEHYHRYLWAAPMVSGRRVLDLASGEGFGAAILADGAESVIGVDLDEPTVEHSRRNYEAPNLSFRIASALDLSEFEPGSFDAVVAFEMIEHVDDHARLIAEIDRVLAAEGILILSTPDRVMYSDAEGQSNPFHRRELTEAELRELLGRHFAHVALWGQRTTSGSRISALDGVGTEAAQAVFIERSGDSWRPSGEPTPVYLVAVASHSTVSAQPPLESNLADYGLEMVAAKEGELVESRRATAEAEAAASAAGAELESLRAEAEALRAEAAAARAESEALRATSARGIAIRIYRRLRR